MRYRKKRRFIFPYNSYNDNTQYDYLKFRYNNQNPFKTENEFINRFFINKQFYLNSLKLNTYSIRRKLFNFILNPKPPLKKVIYYYFNSIIENTKHFVFYFIIFLLENIKYIIYFYIINLFIFYELLEITDINSIEFFGIFMLFGCIYLLLIYISTLFRS